MNGKRIAVAALFSLTLVGTGLARLRPASPPEAGAAGAQMDMSADMGIPSYHAYALKPPFPETMDPKQFPDALNQNVYALAAKIRPVLYQQPCYCYCDRHSGHKSLLDCFVGKHGSECDVCQKEAVLSYQLTKKGKTPEQIRAAIIRGAWKSVNMSPFTMDTSAH